jgi:hypothetical protein
MSSLFSEVTATPVDVPPLSDILAFRAGGVELEILPLEGALLRIVNTVERHFEAAVLAR